MWTPMTLHCSRLKQSPLMSAICQSVYKMTLVTQSFCAQTRRMKLSVLSRSITTCISSVNVGQLVCPFAALSALTDAALLLRTTHKSRGADVMLESTMRSLYTSCGRRVSIFSLIWSMVTAGVPMKGAAFCLLLCDPPVMCCLIYLNTARSPTLSSLSTSHVTRRL